MGVFYTHHWPLEVPNSFTWLRRGLMEVVPAAHLTFGWLKLGEVYPSLSRSFLHVTLRSCIASHRSIALVSCINLLCGCSANRENLEGNWENGAAKSFERSQCMMVSVQVWKLSRSQLGTCKARTVFRHMWAQNPELRTISVTALRNQVTNTYERFYSSHGLKGRWSTINTKKNLNCRREKKQLAAAF